MILMMKSMWKEKEWERAREYINKGMTKPRMIERKVLTKRENIYQSTKDKKQEYKKSEE